jgi:hypothetical protein
MREAYYGRSARLSAAALVLSGAVLGCNEPQSSEDVGKVSQAVDNSPSYYHGAAKQNPLKAIDAPPDPKWTAADDAIIAPIWKGDDFHGSLYAPLFRGAIPGLEDYIYSHPSGDCSGLKGTLRIDWDSAANTVHYLVKGKGFPLHPVVHRTEGVDYFPDQFHNAPKDIDVGAYRLWTVQASVTTKVNFYFDPATLNVLGSSFDFPSGPPPAIPVQFPAFRSTGSQIFSPDANGFISHEYTVAYDHLTTEGGMFSASYVTFTPLSLCFAAPLQPEISQLRPFASPWQPPSDGLSWHQMLQTGVAFDIQVDDASNPYTELGGNLPYIYSGISVAGNVATMRGGVPNGWAMSILGAIRNVGPPLYPIPGGNGPGCTSYLAEPHVSAPNYCLLPPP